MPQPPALLLQVAKWLPIFLEGIREYQEPYRFLAIMGASALVEEAAGQLHLFAEEMVPPLKKALDTREPTTVAVAVELMKAMLATDSSVALVWIQHLWQFCQVSPRKEGGGGVLMAPPSFTDGPSLGAGC